MTAGRLSGTVAAVTGGARGIGLAIARALARQGARVGIGDIDADLARQAAGDIGAHGTALDVRDPASFRRFLDSVREACGPVDVLVNNAGIMPMGPFLDEEDRISDLQIDINLRGVIHGMKLALPPMLERGAGHIVNIASLAGRFAIPGAAVYTATKYAVVGLTEAAAAEYRGSGVHFTAVLPSKVTTELASGTDRAGKGIPAVTPDEVAAAVLRVLRHPRPQVTVPAYLDGLPTLYAAAPQRLRGLARKLLRDDRILKNLDHEQRAGYEQRIRKLA